MKTASLKRVVSLFTCCIGFLLFPLGVVTLVLLFCTGKPIANESSSYSELGFRPGYPFDEMMGIDNDTEVPGVIFSQDARFFARGKPANHALKIYSLIDAEIFDTVNLKSLGQLSGELNFFGFDINRDRKLVAFLGRADQLSGFLTIGELETGNIERIAAKATLITPQYYSSPNGRDLLICSLSAAIHFDLKERRKVSTLPEVPDRENILGFFDENGRAKVLTKGAQVAIWDIDSNKIDSTLDLLRPGEIDLSAVYAAGSVAVVTANCDFVSVNSIKDGHRLHTLGIPSSSIDRIGLTPDSRYLVCHNLKKDDWLTKLEYWLPELYKTEDSGRWGVIEVATGKSWQGLLGYVPFAISNDGKRLVTFTENDRYEYDIPPHWRYCDPLAWVALGLWVILLFCWLKLRGGLRPSLL